LGKKFALIVAAATSMYDEDGRSLPAYEELDVPVGGGHDRALAPYPLVGPMHVHDIGCRDGTHGRE
jgi:hypothetical protein